MAVIIIPVSDQVRRAEEQGRIYQDNTVDGATSLA
jgi:hypothetical protein